MILGIGIDGIEIERFVKWRNYSFKKLCRIFSEEEVAYCLEKPDKSAERFAVRFAAREALYKALSYAYFDTKIPFLTLCAQTKIFMVGPQPHLIFKNEFFDSDNHKIHLSLSHSDNQALAFVIIEKR